MTSLFCRIVDRSCGVAERARGITKAAIWTWYVQTRHMALWASRDGSYYAPFGAMDPKGLMQLWYEYTE